MFKGNQNTTTNTTAKNITYIAKEIEVTGDFNGKGAVQVEGILNGNISVTSVVIGVNGVVNGTIKATNVIVNGKLKGSIFCDTLEVMSNGSVTDEIKVQRVLISGKVDGLIESKNEINIDKTGVVNATTMTSRNILVDGSFKGKVISSELLEIGNTGSVEGDITVKNIKTHEGGRLLGSMQLYTAPKPIEDKPNSELEEKAKA